jgi:DNA-binding transcriptional LysR family regulator
LISNSDSFDYYYSNMEISLLRIIQAVVADPNLTRTSERLHLTQSALSKRIHALEQELGIPLFERRGPRGLKPLPQAIEFSQLAERISNSWESGIKRLKRTPSEPTHFVLVGPTLFLRQIVLPWWTANSPKFPDLRLEVQISPLERVSLETIQAGADAGILEHKEELADYICKPIYTEQWGVVRNPQQKHKDLKMHLWGTYSTHQNPVETWLVQRQKMPPPSYHFYWQDLTAVALWVAETPNAASVLPRHAIARLETEGVVQFESLGTEASSRLYLAYLRESPHKRFLKELSMIHE